MLLYLIPYFYATYHLFNHDKIIKINDYGFTANGSFTLRLNTPNRTGFVIFFLGEEYSTFIRSSYISYNRICNESFPKDIYYRYYLQENKNSTITEVVNKSLVLVPFIANCGQHQLILNVQFKNQYSFLDYREQSLPFIYATISFIYPVITLLWIINSIMYPQFHIKIHTAFAFTAIFKSLSLYLSSRVWYSRSLHDKCSLYLLLVSEVIFVFSHSFLFVVNSLAVSGWNTFRERITFDQVMNSCLVSCWFFIMLSICRCTSYSFILIPLYSMALLVGCIYGQMIYSDIVAAFHFIQLNSIPGSNPMMPMKIGLVIRFSGYVSLWMVLFLFVITYFMVCDVPRYIQNTIYEIFVLCVYIIDFVVFRFKKEYEPYYEPEEDEEKIVEPVKQQLIMLKEPNDEWYSMLDTYRF